MTGTIHELSLPADRAILRSRINQGADVIAVTMTNKHYDTIIDFAWSKSISSVRAY